MVRAFSMGDIAITSFDILIKCKYRITIYMSGSGRFLDMGRGKIFEKFEILQIWGRL